MTAFIVRRRSGLKRLPGWLKERRYTASVYRAHEGRSRDRVIALKHGTTVCGEVVVMDESLFPDALIAVLHGQSAS